MAIACGGWQHIATQLRETIPRRRGNPGGVMPEPTEGPTVLRILLGTQLRRLRESRGVTAHEAARAIRGSESKISRIELGRNAVREVDKASDVERYTAAIDRLSAMSARPNDSKEIIRAMLEDMEGSP